MLLAVQSIVMDNISFIVYLHVYLHSSITPLDDYSLDNNLRPYLYQTHAGELKCTCVCT